MNQKQKTGYRYLYLTLALAGFLLWAVSPAYAQEPLSNGTLTVEVELDGQWHLVATPAFNEFPASRTLDLSDLPAGTDPLQVRLTHSGSTVSLSGTPADGWQFNGWSGTVITTTNPLTLTMTADQVLTATFSELIDETQTVYLPLVVK